jgi:hypothetical protein
VALRGSRGGSCLLHLHGVLLHLGSKTAYKTLNLVDACDVMLETRFQTSRDCLDTLFQSLGMCSIVVYTTLADAKLVVVLLALSPEENDFASELFDDLIGLSLFLLESCALAHQAFDLVLQAEDFGVHLQLDLLLLLAACTFKQFFIL